METNEKLMMLLRLMDEPEAMTEAQLQELLADEEVREMYGLMSDCKKVYKRMNSERMKNKKYELLFTFRKIAAIFLAVVFFGGLAFAAYHFLSSKTEKQSVEVTAPSITGRAEGESSPIRFSNVRLDSILTVVAAHYNCEVCFRDTTAQTLRLSTVWDREDSLAVFLQTLNEFDGLRLTDERDTIFVETLIVEVK